MAQLVVRRLDDETKRKLQRRARRNGRSTEEEVREILRAAVSREDDAAPALGSALAARFAGHRVRTEIPEVRGYPAQPAELDP